MKLRPLPSRVAELATSGKRLARLSLPRLSSLCRRLATGDIQTTPKAREYLLTTQDGAGVVVKSRVLLFAGKGGVGKTYAFIQLAICKAIGRDWLSWRTGSAGRVLLALGEEEIEELQRRIHFACKAYGLTSAEITLVAENITLLPLAGVGAALTYESDSAAGDLPETPRAEELREILRAAVAEGRPYDVVILDPMARFAGADVEKDNAAATRFIQTCETLAAPNCGAPAVIIAHHLRKAGRDDDTEASELIRGAVALLDASRAAMIMAPLKVIDGAPVLVRIRVVKSNYAAIPEPLMLSRGDNGTLRLATDTEISEYDAASPQKGRRASSEPLEPLILAELERGPSSGSELARKIRRSKQSVLQLCSELSAAGLIRNEKHRWHLVPNRFPEPSETPVPVPPFF